MTSSTLTDTTAISCPKCGGQMYDNRLTKKNTKAPDFKCKNRACDGVIWPPKNGAPPVAAAPVIDPLEKPKLTKLYLDATEFVIDKVLPKYAKAGIEVSDSAIIAAVATLFIAGSKER